MNEVVILGTGPSLIKQKPFIDGMQREGVKVFGVNNTFNDFKLDYWIACDPKWHDYYGKIEGDFEKWHWDKNICAKHNYFYVEGRWGDGLSVDPSYIHYNHCSTAQALNIAVHKGFETIYLCGFDMKYGEKRHYFDGLSDRSGEYPAELRKYSPFEGRGDGGLIRCFEKMAEQSGLPKIYNCTLDSALTCFPFKELH